MPSFFDTVRRTLFGDPPKPVVVPKPIAVEPTPPSLPPGASSIDRKKFYDAVRASLFGGTLSDGQVGGMNAILDTWEARPDFTDLRWLAYILATPFVETNKTMQPVREAYYLNPPGPHQNDAIGPAEAYRKTLRYYPWYGRGLPQLTWEENYLKMERLTGVALTKDPDLALDPKISALILFIGMRDGIFTGLSLLYFFNGSTNDPVGARRIINGTDRAEEIAGVYRLFLEALT